MSKIELAQWIIKEIETTPDELQDGLIGIIAIMCRLELDKEEHNER